VRQAIESEGRRVLRGEGRRQCSGSPALGINARPLSELHRVSSLDRPRGTSLPGFGLDRKHTWLLSPGIMAEPYEPWQGNGRSVGRWSLPPRATRFARLIKTRR
jgi:hypothetical protein